MMESRNNVFLDKIIVLILVFLGYYGDGAPSPRLDDAFHVIWQIPSSVCRKNYATVLKGSGITFNEDDVWFEGDYSTILYRKGYGLWPHYLHGQEPPINDGLPQLGNLTAHLERVREIIETAIPNQDYHGIACINMEQFRPLFRRNWGSKDVYRAKSRERVKEKYGHLNPSEDWLEAEAIREFQYHARKYMEVSLRLSEEMRPNAKWGYYNYPYCYNGNPITLHCREGVRDGNDEMRWLWEASTAIMPSTYVYNSADSDYSLAQYMYGNIEEGRRIADSVGGKPVYSYQKTQWSDNKFYRQITMLNGIRLPAEFGINGVILWGSSGALKTDAGCEESYDYVKRVVAPYVSSLTEFTRSCSRKRCNGRGRCVHRGTLDEKYADEVLRTTMKELTDWTIDDRYSCRCFDGYSSTDCKIAADSVIGAAAGFKSPLGPVTLLLLLMGFRSWLIY